ncbi:putative membrane protein YdjX (TVP38/TMEM64 family) [Alkalibacillus flavidus]|uniref:TVP38/TMEM64 family membrane protein n=1 Tax=Alkalibacillus flavidus TaxID=546021 RepID=A0ABV2KSP8_9BACI
MEHTLSWLDDVKQHVPIVAPVMFIIFHIIRPFLFIPVAAICITGGLLFGLTYGTFYSWIGVTLSSLLFYGMVHTSKTNHKMNQLKNHVSHKLDGLSTSQVVLLRLMPFIHFHFISLLMIEITRNFRDYMKLQVLSNVPLAVFYTTLGQWLHTLSWHYIIVLAILFTIMFIILRRREWIWTLDEYFARHAD